ncbi:hypothetical protein [Halalkalicoccus salilacus]|uniref:hypothetical protein n=1 Tax=Halalkalicoccus sp. GCM10025704 TaxID=3252662 RepID=UPI00360B9E07
MAVADWAAPSRRRARDDLRGVSRSPAGVRYAAGCERGGYRGRRGWWVQGVDESVRSDGYRDFTPADQEAAIRRLRSIASATVVTGDWATVEIEPGNQAAVERDL